MLEEVNEAGSSCGVVLFGAGSYGRLALDFFRDTGHRVLAFCDNDASKHAHTIEGIPVWSLTQLASANERTAVIITSNRHHHDIARQVAGLTSLPCLRFNAYVAASLLDRFRHVHDELLADDCSRHIMRTIVEAMLSGDTDLSAIAAPDIYFAVDSFRYPTRDVYVDAGAYVGDTLEQFIWRSHGSFRRIYAFEPGLRQFRALEARRDRLVQEWALSSDQIVCEHGGVAESEGTLPFGENKSELQGSSFAPGNDAGICVRVVALDSYLGSSPVTFIKADIEGFEIQMLKGARKILSHSQPRLALSVYHRPQDLFAIPICVHTLCPDYKIALRHHSTSLLETVLYCWT